MARDARFDPFGHGTRGLGIASILFSVCQLACFAAIRHPALPSPTMIALTRATFLARTSDKRLTSC
jgi:hypothetical protein